MKGGGDRIGKRESHGFLPDRAVVSSGGASVGCSITPVDPTRGMARGELACFNAAAALVAIGGTTPAEAHKQTNERHGMSATEMAFKSSLTDCEMSR